jgi:hypothetical protein
MFLQKLKCLLLFIAVVALSACNDSEQNSALEDYYSLVSVLCECSPIEIIEDQQQWLFDFDNMEIDVVVNGAVDNWLLFDTGRYSFDLIDTNLFGNPATLMQVNGRDFYLWGRGDTITISDPGAEFDAGAYYEFVRD